MKFAFMSFSCPGASLDDMFAMAREYGYDAIEPRIGLGHKHGIELETSDETRKMFKAKARDQGIPYCAIACSARYADPATNQDNIELTLRCIDLAADIGSPRLRIFGGNVPDTISRQQGIDLVAHALRAAADHARYRGVLIVLETHDAWTDPKHVAEVMRRVNDPNVAVNWDAMHPLRQSGVNIESQYQQLKPWIKHFHAHDGELRLDKLVMKPMGTGQIDHRIVMRLLEADGYDGYFCLEYEASEPAQSHLPRELAAMKAYLKPKD